MGFVCKQTDTQLFLHKKSPNLYVFCVDEQALLNRDRSGWKFSGFGRAGIFLIGLGSGRAFLEN